MPGKARREEEIVPILGVLKALSRYQTPEIGQYLKNSHSAWIKKQAARQSTHAPETNPIERVWASPRHKDRNPRAANRQKLASEAEHLKQCTPPPRTARL